MPAFVPSATTLLQAAATDLERDVLPALAGFPRFRTRVIVNLLRLLTRELALGAAADAAERARLQALLDADADDLPALRAELAHRLESGAIDLADDALVQHLRETLRDALAIDHPGWTGEHG
ncbi:DUF6285 domain-containing protein [Variovorax sp. KK3]|uniref:DUF6285 domain-containing protein n=1 Tax=Variovorax sp. KK3 TaxID=1855728 RepID=UPI00097C45C6|nr:DUF6285 domain-containing protein [Variovorax sp. KK3]